MAIDCGPNSPEALECYRRAGVPIGDVRVVLLTHAHPDHCGLAAHFQAAGAKIFLHRDEHEAFQKLSDPDLCLAEQEEVLLVAGVPADQRNRIHLMSRMLRDEFPEFEVDGYLEDGDLFGTCLGTLEVISTPGHTAGHVCFYLGEQKALFAGDHLLLGPYPHLDWTPFRDLAAEFVDSLYRLADFEIDWVLNAHGRPRPEGKAVITDVLTRFWERSENLRNSDSDLPFAVVSSLYKRALHPFELRMAVFEALSILGYPLALRGPSEFEPLAA